MNVRFKEIATITTGWYKKSDPIGNAFYLQGSHFDENGNLKEDAILTKDVWVEGKSKTHILLDKDILLIAKGENTRACLYGDSMGTAVASSLFFVIRVIDKRIKAEFLHWYLNTNYIQALLKHLARGSHIPSLSKKALLDVEIPIPNLSKQQHIVEMAEQWQKERDLMEQIQQEKSKYYELIMLQTANK